MKKVLFISFMLISGVAMGQAYLDKIVQEACGCIERVPDNLDSERYSQELGICMIAASQPYKRELKKEHNINLDDIDSEEGTKLGKLIGLKMASVCPNALLDAASRARGKKNANQPAKESATGTVTKIDSEPFVVFHIRDESGKTARYYWLTFVESDQELAGNYQTLMGKEVEITYHVSEMFDPRIGEYRPFNIIQKVEF